MKNKTTKPNPLKVFNDNNAKAKMKAGGVMKSYKKTLKKAQEGMIQGPMTEDQSKRLSSTADTISNMYPSNVQIMNNKIPVMDPSMYDQKYVNTMMARRMNEVPSSIIFNANSARPERFKQKNGGTVKRKKK
jgi:hypothetical protein